MRHMGIFPFIGGFLYTFSMIFVSPRELTLFKSLEFFSYFKYYAYDHDHFISSTSREQPFELCNISTDNLSIAIYIKCYFMINYPG